jgi:hypothetical protein
MTTRLTFSVLVAGALFMTGFDANDASAQTRPTPGARKQPATPIIQNFPQVQHPSIQATINNAYMNEWSKRVANILIVQPIYIIQPYYGPYYPYAYMNGYNGT